MSVLWAAIASVSWGTADFFAKLSSDRIGAASTLFWAQALGAVLLGGFLLASPWPQAAPSAWLLAIALGLSNTLAILFLYRAFEHGVLSLVSPIASAYPVVSVLLAAVFLESIWTPAKLGGVAAVIGGTLLASWIAESPEVPTRGLARGVPEALIANALMGVTMFGLAYVAESLGSLGTTWVLRSASSIVIILGFLAFKRPIARPSSTLWPVVVGMALFDTAAFYTYNQSLQGGDVAIAAPIAGTFAITTLILAQVILKERLKGYQWLGIAAVLAGIGLVSA